MARTQLAARAGLWAVSLALAAAAAALDPEKAITQFSLRTWQDELPQHTVHSIVQTRDGYIWLGTYEGVARFDGVRFRVHDSVFSKDLKGTSVHDLLEDREGVLWMATNGGLTRYRQGKFDTFGPESGLPSANIQRLLEAEDGQLWVGTDRGVARRAGERFEMMPNAAPEAVRDLERGENGEIWIASDRGLVRWSPTLGSQRLTVEQGLPHAMCRVLLRDRAGALWVGTNAGLARYDGKRFHVLTRADGLPHDFIRALLEDSDGNLWIGTEDGGLARLHDGHVARFGSAEGLAHDYVRSIAEDREGNLWIGTNGGLNQLRDGKFTTYTTREGLTHDFARCIFQDRAGTIWIGTDGGGLTSYDGKTFGAIGVAEGLANASVRAVAEGADGSLWIGTRGGLDRLRGGRLEAYGGRLPNALVRAILEDKSGSLWIGTEGGGLTLLQGNETVVFTSEQGLAGNDVRSIYEDRSGRLWVGTYGGLSLWSGSGFRSYHRSDGLSSDIVFAFHEDADNNLWIGTDSGLNLRRGDRFIPFTVEQGLYDNKVFRILEDDDGYLWLSSNRGLSRISRSELLEVADGKRERATSEGFTKADGMRSNQCNGTSQWAGWRSRDGHLWFPTTRGVVRIDPSDIRRNRLAPPVAIEDLQVDGVSWKLDGGAIRLPANTSKIEVHYTALSFVAPEKVAFRYRLDGFEDAWVNVGPRRTAFFTTLRPGAYTFRVAAANNDGLWNEEGAAFAFEVATPLWATWWAWALYLLAATGLIWAGVRLRIRSLAKANMQLEERVAERTVEVFRSNAALAEKYRELEESERRAHASEERALEANRAKSEFLSNMSHELRTPLNSIIGFASILEERLHGKIEARFEKFLKNILGSANHLLGLINDILDLSKVEAGRMELFFEPLDVNDALEGIRSIMKGVADKKNIAIEFQLPPSMPKLIADGARFKQILFNLVSNAVKFSPDGSPVTIRVQVLEGPDSPLAVPSYRFDVVDHGIGISEKDQQIIFEEFRQADGSRSRHYEGTGLGLSLVRRFLQLHGGTIEVTSQVGSGSTFSAFFPLEGRTAGSRPAPPRVATPTIRRKALVVEDDPIAFHAVASILESEGWIVIGARTGEDALRRAASERPHLVTLDLLLPGLDGWSVLRELKANPATHDIPVIVVTVSGERELGLALGAADVFPKPLDRSSFMARIRQLAKGEGDTRRTILVVDDDPAIAEILSEELRDGEWRLLSAADGARALELLEKAAPAVLVLDLGLPDMSGFEVAHRIASAPQTQRLPIVVLTGMDIGPEEKARLRGRIEAVVSKGGDFRKELSARLKDLAAEFTPAA